MSRNSPLATVGMPVYNGARTLRHALDSILAQSLPDIEVVVSDNASTDGTDEIVAEYASRDDRIRSYRNAENLGARANYNTVLERARGAFFKWAAHDDWIAPQYLERCVYLLQSKPDAVLCYSSMCRVDAQGDTKRLVFPAYTLAHSASAVSRLHDVLWKLPYHPIFGVFRTDALRSVRIPNSPEPDRITLARVALLGGFMQVSEVLFFQRSSEKNNPNRNVWRWLDPDNVGRRRLRMVRVGSELCRGVIESELPRQKQALLCGDVSVCLLAKSMQGKVRQLRRRYRIGYAKGPKIADNFVEDWERRSAMAARHAIGRSSGSTLDHDPS